MKIMSGNVHVGHWPWVNYGLYRSARLTGLLVLLRAHQADVLALREVHDPRVAAHIQRALPEYTWAYSPSGTTWIRWLVLTVIIGLGYYLLGFLGLAAVALLWNSGVGQFVWAANPGLLLGW